MAFALTIDGKPAPASETFAVIDPATGREFAQCPLATVAQLDQAVAAARAAFPGWAALPIEQRAAALNAIADALAAECDDLAALLSQEQGKPVRSAAGEIQGSIHWIRTTAGFRPEIERIDQADGSRAEIHRKPLGVVGSITPWNFPVMIAIWHVMPALLAGNTVVLKPSPSTPLATLRMVEIANRHLPAGVWNVVTGDVEIGSGIAKHPGIDKVVFTGSTPTGRAIMRDGAANLKRLTLELGGNDAAIVLPDADVEAIAPQIFQYAFGNSGQICAAIKRVYVHDTLHDALAERLAELAAAAKVGPGSDPETHYGPVQNRRQFDYVRTLADDARAQGGRFLAGGEPLAGDGYFFPLSIVVDVTDGHRIVDEEQFGPVLPLIRYSDVEDVLARANASENGLGGSVWSADVSRAAALAQRLECGTAWVNSHSKISPDVPFGGAKQSGIGVEFGMHGLDEYMQLQIVRLPAEAA
ncbi:aldehyde dehydrogenase family protein [Sphingomonas lycopersici]|uniref:Aldehyde dehydrogenase family protein n=1 Tax=Sphingomonas lycopersici TaxID=2951807 RepID=A0AA41Z9C6_9SPHN|nr:aldehyde dehydrogenase family protein [Sphingomonas lycopersici]MCW6535328.1 aldehyde dehydrogenase family protein [Sphingomonas lycopersici]